MLHAPQQSVSSRQAWKTRPRSRPDTHGVIPIDYLESASVDSGTDFLSRGALALGNCFYACGAGVASGHDRRKIAGESENRAPATTFISAGIGSFDDCRVSGRGLRSSDRCQEARLPSLSGSA
jgi:hypothetical protein